MNYKLQFVRFAMTLHPYTCTYESTTVLTTKQHCTPRHTIFSLNKFMSTLRSLSLKFKPQDLITPTNDSNNVQCQTSERFFFDWFYQN